MERPAKARKLNDFRRRLPHCSASALGAILQAVQDTGLPEGGVGRDALRAARDCQCNEETPYGSLIEHIWVKTTTGEWHAIPICNPFAFLLVAVRDCCQFNSFLLARLQDHPSTPDKPWTLLIYADEVTPGNPLATMNNRKFHAVYWSFLELGRNALSNEEGWFTILTEYSKYVNQAQGGLSQVFGQVIKVFFDKSGHNFKTAGILLKFPSCSIRLWATLGGILQDGGAHKAASDMLSKVGVTKMFIVTVVLQTDFPFKPQCDAVLALVWLVDLIVAVPTLTIHPSRILAASEDFLERFLFLLGKEIASAWKGSTEFPRGMLEI